MRKGVVLYILTDIFHHLFNMQKLLYLSRREKFRFRCRQLQSSGVCASEKKTGSKQGVRLFVFVWVGVKLAIWHG